MLPPVQSSGLAATSHDRPMHGDITRCGFGNLLVRIRDESCCLETIRASRRDWVSCCVGKGRPSPDETANET